MQPIREIATWARMTGAVMHCDAVQTVGHLPIEVDKLEVDALTLSAHKFGGPKGVGAVVLKPEVKMEATVTGGAQERNRRAGTENVAGICGMAAALKAACDFMDRESVTARAIGAAIVKGLPTGVEVVSNAAKVPHMVQLRTPGKRGEDVVIGMDMRGVAVSQGSACSSGRVQASHVLKAMGFDEQAAGEGVRLSWGWASGEAEVPAVLAALKGVLGI
jgi:cysteine desulfurase